MDLYPFVKDTHDPRAREFQIHEPLSREQRERMLEKERQASMFHKQLEAIKAAARDKRPKQTKAAHTTHLQMAAASSIKEIKSSDPYGLPKLPPRPTPFKSNLTWINKPVSKEKEFNLPPNSDLEILGKLGAYQMSQQSKHTSLSSTTPRPNFLWICLSLMIVVLCFKKRVY